MTSILKRFSEPVRAMALLSRSMQCRGRLDLDGRWHRCALELGCMLSINPDAHSTDEIDLTHWDVEVPSGMRLEFCGAISGNMRLSFQAARSIG